MAKAPKKSATITAPKSAAKAKAATKPAPTEAPMEKPVGATLKKVDPAVAAALLGGATYHAMGFVGATSAPVADTAPLPIAATPRRQSSPRASSLAGQVLRRKVDQALWNSIRNDEVAFYALMGEMALLAASVLAQDESNGQ